MFTDVLLISASLTIAVGLVHDFRYTVSDLRMLQWLAPLMSVIGIGALFMQGMYKVHARYAGIMDLFRLLKASIGIHIACFIGMLAFAYYGGRPFSFAEWVLFSFLSTGSLSAPRIGRRLYDWYIAYAKNQAPRRRALVVGGGDMGEVVMREMRRNPQTELCLVGFVDDDPKKQSLQIHGYPCLG
ncbi:MAG: hypothetical protein CFK48_04035, partial [Armatimonadetes bacterium CP1_7O]